MGAGCAAGEGRFRGGGQRSTMKLEVTWRSSHTDSHNVLFLMQWNGNISIMIQIHLVGIFIVIIYMCGLSTECGDSVLQ